MDARTPILCLVSGRTDMKKVKSLRMKNELFYSLKKLKGILNYIIIITGDTVKCGVNIVIYATHTLKMIVKCFGFYILTQPSGHRLNLYSKIFVRLK